MAEEGEVAAPAADTYDAPTITCIPELCNYITGLNQRPAIIETVKYLNIQNYIGHSLFSLFMKGMSKRVIVTLRQYSGEFDFSNRSPATVR